MRMRRKGGALRFPSPGLPGDAPGFRFYGEVERSGRQSRTCGYRTIMSIPPAQWHIGGYLPKCAAHHLVRRQILGRKQPCQISKMTTRDSLIAHLIVEDGKGDGHLLNKLLDRIFVDRTVHALTSHGWADSARRRRPSCSAVSSRPITPINEYDVPEVPIGSSRLGTVAFRRQRNAGRAPARATAG